MDKARTALENGEIFLLGPKRSWERKALVVCGVGFALVAAWLFTKSPLQRNSFSIHHGQGRGSVMRALGQPDQCQPVEEGVEGCVWSEHPERGSELAGFAVRIFFADGRVDALSTSETENGRRTPWETLINGG